MTTSDVTLLHSSANPMRLVIIPMAKPFFPPHAFPVLNKVNPINQRIRGSEGEPHDMKDIHDAYVKAKGE